MILKFGAEELFKEADDDDDDQVFVNFSLRDFRLRAYCLIILPHTRLSLILDLLFFRLHIH